MLKKIWILTYWPQGRVVCGQNICYDVAAFVILFNLICNMTIFWKKLNFDLLTPSPGSGVSVGKIFATMLLHSWFSLIWYATTPCSEKVLFWPTDSIPRVGSVCGQNICYHVSVFVILFNLICNLTMSWKSKILTYWPRFQGRWWGEGGRGLQRATYLLPCCCI